MMSNDAEYMDHSTCVKSSGSYDPTKDYCFQCVDNDDDDGTLGYCWNSNQGCEPACANAQLHDDEVYGAAGVGEEEGGGRATCGAACHTFSQKNAGS